MTKQKEITIKTETLKTWAIIGLAVLLVISILTGGFSGKSTVNTQDSGNNQEKNIPTANVKLLEDETLFPAIGPKNAKHTVIEFSDFQCPYCGIASGLPSWTTQYQTQYAELFGLGKNVKDLAKQGDIRFIYVPMSFLGPESVYAAQAALCANKQKKFWEMHDILFGAQTSKEHDGKFEKENLKTLAKDIDGLDTTEFNNCLDNDETLNDVKKVATTASQFAKGTPTFFVDGKKAPTSWSQISSLLN